MRRLSLLLFLLSAMTLPVWAQQGNTVIRLFAGAPSGTCASVQIAVNTTNGDFYDCLSGSWNLVTGGVGGGYATVQEEGTPVTQRTVLNFVGGAVTAADDTTRTTVTLSASPDSASVVGTGRTVSTSAPLGGGGALSGDLTLTCATCEVTTNKNAASGYAGLTAGTKLTLAQGQEVWALADLTDVSATTGAGTTAMLNQVPVLNSYTVAGLPAAGTANRIAIVTDASTAGSCTSGGGAARSFCRDTGAAWEPLGDGTSAGGGITTLNTLTADPQVFAVGTAGTDFAISSVTATHTFNLPTASSTVRGALSSADWTTFNNKVPTSITLTAAAGLSGGGDLSTNRSFATDSTEAAFISTTPVTCGAATAGRAAVIDGQLEFCDNNATPALLKTPINTTATASQFFTAFNAVTGAFTKAQPAFTDISGSVADGQLSANVALYNNGSKTWGGNAAFTWSFDDDAATSPSLAFSAGGVTLTATGTNQNVTLTPSGTGVVSSTVFTASTGFRQGTVTAGNVLRGNGTNFVSATLDFSDLTGTVGDTQIAAGAVDGGTTGEIADGTITSADLIAANKTFTKSLTIFDPVTGDSNDIQMYFGQAVTITRVACSVAAATSVTIQLDERAEATPNTAGTDVMTSALVCDTDSQATTTFTNATIALRVPLNLQVTAVSGTPGAVRVHIEGTYD